MRRADFIIEGVLVEIKAKAMLENKDFEQLFSYLKSSDFRIGLLLNFGADKLEFKRRINFAGHL
jgi:GxxExxY protein